MRPVIDSWAHQMGKSEIFESIFQVRLPSQRLATGVLISQAVQAKGVAQPGKSVSLTFHLMMLIENLYRGSGQGEEIARILTS